MGFLKKLFGGKEGQFQQQVVQVLEKHYPSVNIRAGESPAKIRFADVELDLGKLLAVCEKNSTQAPDLIQQYFSYPFLLSARVQPTSAQEAVSLLRPQLAPAEFASRFGVASIPFSDEIVSALVLKSGSAMPFVRQEELESWQLTLNGAHEIALSNLDKDPMEMEVTITDGTDRFIGMETHDGFDAARILLPRVRNFAATKLGTQYLGGLPNRDFLILWARECSPRFHDYTDEKIETDYTIQPYPLSTARFEVSPEGIKKI